MVGRFFHSIWFPVTLLAFALCVCGGLIVAIGKGVWI